MRVIIAGGRDFNDYDLLKKTVTDIISNAIPEIISGCAKGADRLGERFAKEYGYSLVKFPAKWEEFGKKAGYIRNIEMAKYSISDDAEGVLIAFWDGESKGTKHMIDIAKRYNLESHVIRY